METHQRKDRQKRERQRGKNKPETLCYRTVALLIVSVAFFSYDGKRCHTSLSPSVEGKDKSGTQQVGAVALSWNSSRSSHPLSLHEPKTFVGFRVCLYIFQWFCKYSLPHVEYSLCDENRTDTQGSLGPEKFWTKIKPEMPVGLQAVITTAPIKCCLDGNPKWHVSMG